MIFFWIILCVYLTIGAVFADFIYQNLKDADVVKDGNKSIAIPLCVLLALVWPFPFVKVVIPSIREYRSQKKKEV